MRGHRPSQPDVTADHAASANRGGAAEYRGSRINHDVIFDCGVPFLATYQPAFRIHGKAQRAERHALIYFDVVSNNCRLADYNSSSVIDKESAADRGARMNVDAGHRVS